MTTAEFLQALRSWTTEQAPGLLPSHLMIHFHNSTTPLQLPIGPYVAATSAADERHGRGLSPCVLDILAVLREIKRPLSRTRLLEEMARRGMDWNERTVAGYLARLVEDGTLENPPEARPRGYRLSETSDGEE